MPKSDYWEEPTYFPEFYDYPDDDGEPKHEVMLLLIEERLANEAKGLCSHSEVDIFEPFPDFIPPKPTEVKDPPRIRFQVGTMEKWFHALTQHLTKERARVVELEIENAALRTTMARITKILDGSDVME